MANTGRMNLLEEEGRIKSEPQTKNVKAEEKRVVGEIKKGYKKGGRIGFKHGSYKTVPPSMGHTAYVTKDEDKKIAEANKKANASKKQRRFGPSKGSGRPKGGWTS